MPSPPALTARDAVDVAGTIVKAGVLAGGNARRELILDSVPHAGDTALALNLILADWGAVVGRRRPGEHDLLFAACRRQRHLIRRPEDRWPP